MKLLVFGGRDYEWISVAWGALDALHRRRPVSLIMHGGARGADRLADRWAINRGVPLKRYPAPWYEVINVPGAVVKLNGAGKPYNAIAGHWRNQRMADAKPDLGLQFPGGTGTADMRHRLDGAGIPVIQVYTHHFDRHTRQEFLNEVDEWMLTL